MERAVHKAGNVPRKRPDDKAMKQSSIALAYKGQVDYCLGFVDGQCWGKIRHGMGWSGKETIRQTLECLAEHMGCQERLVAADKVGLAGEHRVHVQH